MTRLILLFCASLALPAQDFKTLEQKVSDFTLPNGFRFIVIERHDSPVVSFVTHIAAGTANDSPGLTGLASFFERLAFKGTESLGTRDAATEKKALDTLEDAYTRLDAEKAKGRRANELDIVRIELEVHKALMAAQAYAAPQDFQAAFDDNGASALNARVSADSSQIRIVLPSNRAELWFFLESQWMARPIFGDFYRERDAIAPGRNREGETVGVKALQTLASTAFTEHPYRNPALGWPAEFSQLRHSDARQFFHRYYVPGNITIGISGDIRPEEARRFAEKYFGSIPPRPLPPSTRAQEPAQSGPRTAVIENAPTEFLAIGFKRPDQIDREHAVLEVLQALLAASRSSLLARELIETRRTAATVAVVSAFPGGRSPSLFTLLVTPLAGHTVEENEKAVLAVLARLQNEPVDDESLGRAKAHLRSALARRLSDNSSIAAILAQYASEYGDWRAAFTASDAIAKVTAAQVQAAAAKYLIPARRTTVSALQPAPVAAPKGAAK